MKIIFFGTSPVALPILDALHAEHHILAVVTQPDGVVGRKKEVLQSPIAERASTLGLPVLKPEKVKGNNEFLKQLKHYNADIFIVVSYGKILPEDLINLPPYKTLNVHFSLLPEYRGASPLQAALRDGKTETGTSIFVLDKGLDHGPIVAQQHISIAPEDTFTTLAQKASIASARLLTNVLPDYVSGKITPQVQDHSKATHCGILSKEDGKIDWTNTASEIHNQYRAYIEWPGIWTIWEGKKLKILSCTPHSANTSDPPGTVLPDGSIVCGNNTVVAVQQLQLEGKNTQNTKSFLNGYPRFAGSLLR